MDEYGNIKAEHFKNDHLSFAMATVPVFPPRPMTGVGNPFQNSPMSSPYCFNMDGPLGHPHSIYNPSHHPNTPKMTPRPPDVDTCQMNHGFSKPNAMTYHNFSSINSCNLVTANGFFSLNSAEIPKHSYEDVLNSPTHFSTDLSMNTQLMPPKTQYLEASSSVMADISHFSQESVNSYIQNVNSAPLVTQIVESKKRSAKCQKTIPNPKLASTNILQVDGVDPGHRENDNLLEIKNTHDNVMSDVGSETVVNSDLLTKLYCIKNLYKCGFCDLKVSSNEALLGHINTHTNLLPYHCGICGVAFIEGSELLKHVHHSHSVKAPYACGLCTSAFHQNVELKAHMETHDKTGASDSKAKLPLYCSHKGEERSASKSDDSVREEETEGEDDDDEEDDDDDDNSDPENLDPASQCINSNSNTIIIGKDTDFTLRKGPSKIVMDDIDLNSACTIIVEPSSAGGIRKKHLFKCNFCDKVCKDKGSLVSHVRTHTKGRPYECSICFAKFKQYAHLSDHIMTKHTKERPFVCDRCAKTFNRKSHLQDHIRLRHTEDKLYHCPECPATFQKRSEFSEHKRTHGKPPPKYQCNMCPRQFRNVTDFERHIRSHTKEKRYECEVCHLTFGLLANAKKHMIKHSEERPFKCEVCPKAYHFEHDFKRHKMTHLKKKPFPCPDCYKSFKKAALLKKHAKEAHMKNEEDPIKKPFKCLACKKRFKFQWDLDRHRKIHAKKKPFPCLYCYKTYGSEAMLIKHAKVHDGQDLPLYDHSRDVINEYELENRPKKRGRRPKLKAESDELARIQADNQSLKRRGRGMHKVVSHSKYHGHPSRQRNNSETDEKLTPSLKITFRRKKTSKRKFQCQRCNKSFMSNPMLRKHLRVHDEDSDDDTESISYSESTNDALPLNENDSDVHSLKAKFNVSRREMRSNNCEKDAGDLTRDETRMKGDEENVHTVLSSLNDKAQNKKKQQHASGLFSNFSSNRKEDDSLQVSD